MTRLVDAVEGAEAIRSLERIPAGDQGRQAVATICLVERSGRGDETAVGGRHAMNPNPPCPFCSKHEAVLENPLAYVLFDKNPVTPGHCLIIPFRHVADYFDTTQRERQAMLSLADAAKTILDRDFAPRGYNIGINVGEVAGQTVPHVHLHLIPRYPNDVGNPRGGVRGVIPARQNY
jgi:diadenosine tetraphosphate (Ap4A) HIT family hydrolase